VIRLDEIQKSYGTILALDKVSFEVEKGQLAVLIGPSGCGKSTLLRIVNRMIEPTGGRLMIDGRDALTTDPVALRRSIGYVIQSTGLFPHLSVLDNIEVVPRLLGWTRQRRRARSLEMMSLVRLDAGRFGDRYPKELSGGQQQRVGLARALAADPAVMLMDEPFSAVDPITREQLQEEFMRIQATVRKTIVFVTHDIDEAVRLGDRICLMRDGQVEQYAAPDELLHHPATEFAALFVGEERELTRLGRHTVEDFMRRDVSAAPAQHSVPERTPARAALSKLLGGVAALDVVDASGQRIGRVELQDFARAL